MRIALTQGQYAIVDAADYEWLNKYSWQYRKSNRAQTGYAVRARLKSDDNEDATVVRMHNAITGKKFTDHINHNGLDNRRVNLRVADMQKQSCNRARRIDNCSGSKGVTLAKDHKGTPKYYRARITVNGKTITIGNFKTLAEASEAYATAAKNLHGEFACLKN